MRKRFSYLHKLRPHSTESGEIVTRRPASCDPHGSWLEWTFQGNDETHGMRWMIDQPEVRRFREVSDRLFALYRDREYQEALEYVLREADHLPHRSGRVAFWTACLGCLTGNPDEGLRVLKAGLREGHWWSEQWLTGDPDLRSLQGRPELAAIIEESRRLQASAQKSARPDLRIVAPDTGQIRGILLCLHGYGSNAEDSLAYWAGATATGFVVAAPQSSQMVSEDGFCWDDEARTREEVIEAVGSLNAEFAIDSGTIVLAGFSQGARRAVELALLGDAIGFKRVFFVAPSLREQDLDRLVASMPGAKERGMQMYSIVGESDRYVENSRLLQRRLSEHGVRSELQVVPGLGHEFPRDFEDQLLKALEFLTAGST